MYHVEGKAEDAHDLLEKALRASAPRGFFRIFLDEGELMCSLLKSVAPRLKDSELSAYVKRLLDAMLGESEKVKPEAAKEERLSEREVDVLHRLAAGESYKEIGQKLYLSLNTVQFHVKSIYRKLSVNKRTQAIEKAREMNLI